MSARMTAAHLVSRHTTGIAAHNELKKNAYRTGVEKYCMPIVTAAHTAKKYMKWEINKVSAAKRAKKWQQLNTKCIRDYHKFIGAELKKLKRRGK